MKMTALMMIYLILLLIITNIEGRSEEFNKCINPEKTIIYASDCTKIQIPDSEGYNCCAMKITFNQDSTYSCLALEKKYTSSQEVLNEYISKNNISMLFASVGGKMEIDCGNKLKISENYKKLSNEYLNCYNNHIKGIENENNCTKNDIPSSEGSKCCFVETSTKNDNGNIVNDKRCYIIQDEYFTKNKNLNNYLLDESNNNLDEYSHTNISITCKNYGTFFYSGFDNTIKIPVPTPNEGSDTIEHIDTTDGFSYKRPPSSSGIKSWVIILIIIGGIIFIGIIILISCCCVKRRNKDSKNEKDSTYVVGIQNNINNNNQKIN